MRDEGGGQRPFPVLLAIFDPKFVSKIGFPRKYFLRFFIIDLIINWGEENLTHPPFALVNRERMELKPNMRIILF